MFGSLALISTTFLGILTAIGVDSTFYGFGGFSVLSIIVLYFNMKETKGLSTEEKTYLYRTKPETLPERKNSSVQQDPDQTVES